MVFTKDDKQLLGNIRQKLNDAFVYCVKNKYDGRPLVEAWGRYLEVARSIGGKPESKHFHKAEYWDDPETYSNHANNKNPIIRVTENFEIIRQKDLAKSTKGRVQSDIIDTKNNNQMQPRRTIIEHQPTKPVQPYYYKVNISWVERNDTPKDVIKRVLHYLEVTGLEPVKIHDFNNGHEIEKTAEFKMQGNEGEFRWVKRGVMGLLDCLVGGIPEFNIAISGKKYEDFEIDENKQQ